MGGVYGNGAGRLFGLYSATGRAGSVYVGLCLPLARNGRGSGIGIRYF